MSGEGLTEKQIHDAEVLHKKFVDVEGAAQLDSGVTDVFCVDDAELHESALLLDWPADSGVARAIGEPLIDLTQDEPIIDLRDKYPGVDEEPFVVPDKEAEEAATRKTPEERVTKQRYRIFGGKTSSRTSRVNISSDSESTGRESKRFSENSSDSHDLQPTNETPLPEQKRFTRKRIRRFAAAVVGFATVTAGAVLWASRSDGGETEPIRSQDFTTTTVFEEPNTTTSISSEMTFPPVSLIPPAENLERSPEEANRMSQENTSMATSALEDARNYAAAYAKFNSFTEADDAAFAEMDRYLSEHSIEDFRRVVPVAWAEEQTKNAQA